MRWSGTSRVGYEERPVIERVEGRSKAVLSVYSVHVENTQDIIGIGGGGPQAPLSGPVAMVRQLRTAYYTARQCSEYSQHQ